MNASIVPPSPTDADRELWLSSRDPAFFIDNHCWIEDATAGEWVPFRLWPAQIDTVDILRAVDQVVILKARQLGFTWLVLGYALWLMIFRPAATVLLFSRRDDEAIDLLGYRLKGMFSRLHPWLQVAERKPNADHKWSLANGSRALAFPTTGGRSYTGSLVVVDEADFVPDLQRLLNAVKPTIDAGGQLFLLSTADKDRPESPFKKIYQGARAGANAYRHVFHGWNARPERTPEWYAAQRRDVLANTGALDDLHQEYPASDAEALAPRTLNKRIAPSWLQQCYVEQRSLAAADDLSRTDRLYRDAPAIPGLVVYRMPVAGRRYVIGADPAEGNPTSDDSSLTVLDMDTGEEVAHLAGKLQPEVVAAHAHRLGLWYNRADLMVERNNHGHAVLGWLRDNSPLRRLTGHDGNVGWLSSAKGKALLYDRCAEAFRERETILHTFATYTQLASIEGATLRAPEGQLDDRADSYALALAGVVKAIKTKPAPPVSLGGGLVRYGSGVRETL